VWNFAAPLSQSEESGTPAPGLLGEARLNRVRGALEIFRLRNGNYPDRLDALLAEKLLYPSDIQPLGREPVPYMTVNSGAGYLLGDAAKAAMVAEGKPR
jgi:hypothetical protein